MQTGRDWMDESVNEQGTQVDFDSIRLYPGAVFQIEQVGRPTNKYNLRYIGAIKGKSILLTIPVVEGRIANMPPGQTYVVRGFNGKYAYAFSSRVIQARSRPFPYVHFTYPESVESRIIRKALRVTVNLPAAIIKEDGQTPITIIDLSANGLMMGTARPVGEVGDIIRIQFEIEADGARNTLTIPVKIRNAKYSKDANSINVGAEFGEMAESDMLRLNNFILSRSLES